MPAEELKKSRKSHTATATAQRFSSTDRYPTSLRAMGDRRADGIDVGVGNEQVRVRAVLAERVVTVELQFLAGLPPAVDGCHNVRDAVSR